jgi:hypothetical protein
MVSISRNIIPRQADCSRSIPDQGDESFTRERVEMKPELISFEGNGTHRPWKYNKNDSDLKGVMSRLHKENKSADVAIEKVFML